MSIKNLSRKIGGFTLAALMLAGITVFSTTEASAQRRAGRGGGVIVRPIIRPVRPYRYYNPNRYYNPYGPFGWNDGFYGNGFYGNNTYYNPYSQYIFDNSEEAAQKASKQGYKTGEEDGRKNKSFSYERSHYYKEAGFGNFGEVYRRNFARSYRSGFDDGQSNADAKERNKLGD